MITRRKRRLSGSPLVGFEDELILSPHPSSSTPLRSPPQVITLNSPDSLLFSTLSDTSDTASPSTNKARSAKTSAGTPPRTTRDRTRDTTSLDDILTDICKNRTPTPRKKNTAVATDEFTNESDSMFLDLIQSAGKVCTAITSETGDTVESCTFVPSSPPADGASFVLESQGKEESQQSLPSQNDKTSQDGSQGTSMISRLQKRYQRGIAIASQNITQPSVTQNTQAVQNERLKQVQKLADSLATELPIVDVMPSMDEGFYGLPETVREAMTRLRGIKKLYDWQDACLRLECLRKRSNLIYSSPTSGGKTLVAEILMLRELLLRRRDCLLILPFVSLVQEKIRGMSELAVELDFLIEEYAGSRGGYPPKRRQSRKAIYIATIEKASSLINSLIDSNKLDSIGLCVVDELHMLGEPGGRGATLEMTLTKLMLASKNTQVVGMSATLNNMKDLSNFLNAESYINDFRPVQLEEYVKLGDDIYKVDPRPVPLEEKLKHHRPLTYNYDAAMKSRDPDFLAGLLLEVIPRYSCLIFCPTKKNCESVAQLVCSFMPRAMKDVKKAERELLLSEIVDNCGQICPILSKTLLYGVAYHHSGLTMDERKLVEEAYISETLCCIICTSTLAAGVNLPARRVIVRAPYVGLSVLESSQYRQMIGRAGRAGIDTLGESILIIQSKDRDKLNKLIAGPVTVCRSSLNLADGRGMRKFILNLIGIKLCSSVRDVYSALSSTLFAKQADNSQAIELACDSALAQLADLQLVVQKCDSQGYNRLEITELGIATYKGSIDVDIANRLYNDLCEAQLALSLQSYLHLIYLITPYELVTQIKPDWSLMFNMHGRLTSDDLHIANTIGITERFLHRKTMNYRTIDKKVEMAHTRFFVALMLYDLYRESPVWEVAEKYKQNRGFVQSMLQTAISFASCVYYFSMELEQFWAYHALYETFIKKFSLCAKPELNVLMELPGVKIGKARLLYKAGYKSLQEIAYSEHNDLISKVDYMTHVQARQLKASAMMLMQEKSEVLRAEADAVIALPTPVPDVSP